MHWRSWAALYLVMLCVLALPAGLPGQTQSSSSSLPSTSSTSAKHTKKNTAATDSGLDAGGVVGAVYRNKSLGMSCKIPPGWVLRTAEMSAKEDSAGEISTPPGSQKNTEGTAQAQGEHGNADEGRGRVLLAAFSRPPEARGEDVNASILIAAEKVETYPGMTEPAQYFGPLTEIAKAQGFAVDEEPYEIELGTKKLVRGDFHKDVGSRVMVQSTVAWLAKGYAISVTVIGGTEVQVEELIEGLEFTGK